MYFKDVFTELQESMMSAINKKAKLCPKCGQAMLKRNSTIEHYAEVAAFKFAGTCALGVGAAVPAPDYRYKCPNCKNIFMLVDGKFVQISKNKKAGGGI